MVWFDAHCDTLTKAFSEKHYSLKKNRGHWDTTRAKDLGESIGTFAAFLNDGAKSPFLTALQMFRILKEEPEIAVVKSREEANEALSKGKLPAFLSVENGLALEGSLEKLSVLAKEGIRFFGLTWNGQNELASGTLVKNPGGLTPFGRSVLKRLEEKAIFADVSHLAEPGFWEVIKLSSRPVVATHSNAYHLCPHPRNLKDDQFRAICETGGVVGINYYSPFLRSEGRADLSDLLRHMDHFLSLGGENHIGLGSDFDGMDLPARGIDGVEDLPKIREVLLKEGFGEVLTEKILGGNFLNLL